MTDARAKAADATRPPAAGQRLDKWLFFTRTVKSRSLAAALVADGRVRVNRERVDRPAFTVKPGDVVTLAVQARVRVLKVTGPGLRRGPPAEARTLYEDLSPPAPPRADLTAPLRDAGAGRPTKRDRRAIERLTAEDD